METKVKKHPGVSWLRAFVALVLLMLGAAGAHATTVVCEPQGGANPNHPVWYFYDVTPEVEKWWNSSVCAPKT